LSAELGKTKGNLKSVEIEILAVLINRIFDAAWFFRGVIFCSGYFRGLHDSA